MNRFSTSRRDVDQVDHGRRRRLERYWFALVMLWSLCRIAAVWHWLDGYGVNTVIYAVVDLGSSLPYAVSSARTIGALVDRHHGGALGWGVVAAVSFSIPDVYIVAAGRDMPWKVYIVVGLVAVVAGAWAVRTGGRDVVAGRVI